MIIFQSPAQITEIISICCTAVIAISSPIILSRIRCHRAQCSAHLRYTVDIYIYSLVFYEIKMYFLIFSNQYLTYTFCSDIGHCNTLEWDSGNPAASSSYQKSPHRPRLIGNLCAIPSPYLRIFKPAIINVLMFLISLLASASQFLFIIRGEADWGTLSIPPCVRISVYCYAKVRQARWPRSSQPPLQQCLHIVVSIMRRLTGPALQLTVLCCYTLHWQHWELLTIDKCIT